MDVVDSDVLLIDLRYPRDAKYADNDRFLRTRGEPRATTVFNLLEVCGVLSFNLSERALLALYGDLDRRYSLQILHPPVEGLTGADLLTQLLESVVHKIRRKMAFGDAQIMWVAEAYPEVTSFISWNARHFEGKTRMSCLTPAEWLSLHKGA